MPTALLAELARCGVRLAAEGDRLRYEAPPGIMTPELLQELRQHKPVIMGLLQGAEADAGPDWRPGLGESWPAAWNDGRCVRCNGRRWRWSHDEARWMCATCGVTDPDLPMPKPSAPAQEPGNHASSDDRDGWPPECLASERLYGTRAARLYPLLGKRVTTPAGSGVLLQAFSSRAAVLVNGAVLHLKPEELSP